MFVALLQAFLAWKIPNYMHRMMSSFFMALSLGFFFLSVGIPELYLILLTFMVAWLYLNEFNFENIKKFQSIAYGLLAGLISLKISLFFNTPMLDFYYYSRNNISIEVSPLLFELLTMFVLAYVVWKILGQQGKRKDVKVMLFSFVAVILVGLLSFQVSGLLMGIILMLVGFSVSHRLLMGVGIVSVLGFISYYYYFMGETLMQKAGLLAVVGISLLLVRYVLKKVLGEAQNV